MDQDLKVKTKAITEKTDEKLKFEINNINKIILNILCTEAIKKIKFLLYILKELLKHKTNILHAYISTNFDNLLTEQKQKENFNLLQEEIELCDDEEEYENIKKKIEKYIDTLKETNEVLCQNSPIERNTRENRNKIIEDGTLLLNIFRNLKKLDFSSVRNELRIFKDEQNLLLNLKQSIYHKKQIINILEDQIKEQIKNKKIKKKKMEEMIKQIEKRKKIFFVKSMLYYIYKEEYVLAEVANYEMSVNYKYNSTKTMNEEMKQKMLEYENINNYIKEFLNKRNDHLQHIHDELVEYYEREKTKKDQKLEETKKAIEETKKNIELKRNKIIQYEESNKELENYEKLKLKKEIDEREALVKYNECILFLQNVGRRKIAEDAEMKKKEKKKAQKKAQKKKK